MWRGDELMSKAGVKRKEEGRRNEMQINDSMNAGRQTQ